MLSLPYDSLAASTMRLSMDFTALASRLPMPDSSASSINHFPVVASITSFCASPMPRLSEK